MKWTWVSIIPGITNKSLASTLSPAGKNRSVIWATLPSVTYRSALSHATGAHERAIFYTEIKRLR